MSKAVQRRTRDAFILVLLVPIITGLATLWLGRVNGENMKWVAHSQEVLRIVNRIVARAYEAESNQRGFLLTGDTSFLALYRTYSAEEWSELKRFGGLTSDNPVQQRNAAKLLNLWSDRASRMERVLEIHKGQSSGSATAQVLREGRDLMDSMNSIATGMTSEEVRLLRERMDRQRRSEVELELLLAGAVVVNVLLLYWANKLIRNYGIARDAAEMEIRRANAELEDRVQERTSELQAANDNLLRSNQDLTHFAYVASHDLQEPLRTVGSYAGLLAKRYQGQLDAQADKYIGFIVGGAKRMQNMVQDLLMYSRTGTQQFIFSRVDLDEVLAAVQQNLRLAIAESHGQIIAEPLPTLEGDESKLTMVLQNLVSNGLKFRHPDRPPAIRVSARKEGHDWVMTVQDNGIGFDQQYSDRIFVIFQRLHQVGEYPGTGIGLAICKRIVEGHGGHIWAHSTRGEGSTFSFSVPVNASRLMMQARADEASLQTQKG
jgi:signal transduction histidine kinase